MRSDSFIWRLSSRKCIVTDSAPYFSAEKYGAESVTIHLREDRRHINESDLKRIITKLRIPLNLEIAATKEMLKIALKRKPPFICIVPEKRKEITTEGGLNLNYRRKFLAKNFLL